MDEGWTRFVLDQYAIPYATLHNADIQAGSLARRIDVLVIPSVSAQTLNTGFSRGTTAPPYVGGIEASGVAAIEAFVQAGGVLVCVEDSARWAIERLHLPVKELVGTLPRREFYGPGSVVRLTYHAVDAPGPTLGMPPEGCAFFDRSFAFEPDTANDTTLARYATTGPLESGFIVGADRIAGKSAVVRVRRGTGEVVLFAFPVIHRGQTLATFRLLLNTLFEYRQTPSQSSPAVLGR
jgi:hypothetical protein